MKKFIVLSAMALTVMFLLTQTLCASGFQLNEHGSRSMAQGGAYAARAYDGSAIFFNPAGLGFQKGTSIYLGTTIIVPTTSFFGPTYLNSSAETKMNTQVFTPINVYGTYELMDGLTLGLGINNPYGLGTEWPEDWAGKRLSEKIDLMTFYITPTIGYRLLDNLSIGAGINYVTGSVDLRRIASTTLPDGTIKPFPFSPEPRLIMDLSATGWGYNVGVIYKLIPEISIGASYRSEVKIAASGNAVFIPNYLALNQLPRGEVTSSITMPATAFLGIAYKIMPELEIEADYQFVGWSSYKELKFDFKANNSTVTSPKNYEDSYILRIGGEYTMDNIQLRAGFFYDKSPVKDKYVEPLLPDADRNGYNIGIGYKLTDNLSVDLSYMFIKFQQRTVTNSILGFNGTYNNNANLFGLNFGYSF